MLLFKSGIYRTILAAGILCTALIDPNLSMGADLYRWIDEDGVAHYSDQPPQSSGSKGKDVKVSKMREGTSVPPNITGEERGREFIIPFKRAYGGMLVDLVINDHLPARMIVDTGATTVKINVKLLKKLNQNLPANPRKGKAVTAAGVVEAHEVFIEKIDLGGAVKRYVQASYIDEMYDHPNYDGLLGLSFFSDFKMTIDYDKNEIHLKR